MTLVSNGRRGQLNVCENEYMYHVLDLQMNDATKRASLFWQKDVISHYKIDMKNESFLAMEAAIVDNLTKMGFQPS